jgi:hypothetical protein
MTFLFGFEHRNQTIQQKPAARLCELLSQSSYLVSLNTKTLLNDT